MHESVGAWAVGRNDYFGSGLKGRAHEAKKFEDVIEDKGVKIFIDPASTMFLIGCEMDYVEDRIQSGFVFSNPKAKATCGCGSSFAT